MGLEALAPSPNEYAKAVYESEKAAMAAGEFRETPERTPISRFTATEDEDTLAEQDDAADITLESVSRRLRVNSYGDWMVGGA